MIASGHIERGMSSESITSISTYNAFEKFLLERTRIEGLSFYIIEDYDL